MSRESENTLLLLIGLATGMITLTGAFTRYVKPALMPWLYVTAAVLIGLALVAMIDDVRRRANHEGHHGHSHANLVTWLLLLPAVVLIFITPPALLPQCRRAECSYRTDRGVAEALSSSAGWPGAGGANPQRDASRRPGFSRHPE